MNRQERERSFQQKEVKEVYPPITLYEWKKPEELTSTALEKLRDQYAQFPQMRLKEILLLNGHSEEVTLTSIVLNFSHYLLMHEPSDFPTLDGVLRQRIPNFQKQTSTTVSPCNFELGKLSEYDEHLLIFSKLRIAPDEMYEEARDKILTGANQLLSAMNRKQIPEIKNKN